MKIIKKSAIVIISLFMIIILCSCSKKEMENVQIVTNLNIAEDFSGSRTIIVSYPESVFAPDSETAESLEAAVRKNCPSSMTYSRKTYDDRTEYTYVLAFSSISDYRSKLSEFLGNEPSVVFSNSNSVLTKGWRIKEDFESGQLIGWIKKCAKNESVDFPDYKTEERTTTVTFKNQTESCGKIISVNKRSGSPMEKISITTVNKTTATESLFDRTISFMMTQKTFDALGDKVKQYFNSVTDESAQTEWNLENEHYIYTVIYEDINLKQLEGYTNRLFSSVYGDITYVDKTVGSTALAYQNSYTETMDFSAYVGPGNEDVLVEYTYSLSGNSKLDECRIYNDLKWTAATDLMETNNPGKIAAVYSSAASLTLRINDGKQYVPESVDISVTPLENNNIRKAISFIYDISKNGYEATDYTASYFEQEGLSAEKTVEDGNSVCTVSVSGSAEEINVKLTDIFGDANIITADSEVPFMTLRTKKITEDTVDLSSILVGDNIDTPINYFVIPSEGEMAEELTLQYADSEDVVVCEPDKDNVYTFRLSSTQAKLRSVVSAPNVADIIIFCIIGIIMILTATGFILYFRSRIHSSPELDEGERKARLGQEKRKSKTLARVEKKQDEMKEKEEKEENDL